SSFWKQQIYAPFSMPVSRLHLQPMLMMRQQGWYMYWRIHNCGKANIRGMRSTLHSSSTLL
ncbi:hypothetical protein CISIN_1g0286131mg, partial [Citrus sinensis]